MATIGDVLRHVLKHSGGLSETNRAELEEAIEDFDRRVSAAPESGQAPKPAPLMAPAAG